MRIRLAAAALSTTPLDWHGNLELCRRAVQQAHQAQTSILVLPELCLSGYGCEDQFLSPWVPERAWLSLQELQRELPTGLLVAAGLPLRLHGKVYNAVALVHHEGIAGIACKRHLAREGIHYETRWFTPWPAGQIVRDSELGCPVGDQIFVWNGVRIGVEICEDAWAVHRPGLDLAAAECDVILAPSASHFAMGKDAIRERLVLEGSRSLGVAFVYANLNGNESGRVIYDGACRIACAGQLLSEGPRLAWSDCSVTVADADLSLLRTQRAVSGHSHHLTPPTPTRIATTAHFGAGEAPESLPSPSYGPHEEFARATALGMWDYLRKARAQGWVLSLSGGADSAACAVLVNLACHWALQELGETVVRQKLSWIELPETLDARSLTNALLLCAYQSTRNSGNVTRQAAQTVAAGTGAEFHAWDVDELVQGYVHLAETALGRKLHWQQDDLALQNVQARVRAPSVWLLANATNRLLITTSNRSEMAVGYATMDGDTAGSLSPLAGIDKHFLLQWLVQMQTEGLQSAPPCEYLSVITQQAPTAELRPRQEGVPEQTDEADLMPYPLLSRLEILAVRERRSPAECLAALERDGTWSDSRAQILQWVVRYFRLWSRNQWKRERYAPSFHLDAHNLDPRSWCRFPILSSGFQEELEALQKQL
jgi:NAD+ synthase (glutamine-hydrolysing)